MDSNMQVSGARQHAPHDRRHRWKVLGVGFAANASFAAAFSGIPTTAVFIRSGYHIGNSGLGLVLGMLGLGIALSELPWGLLTDRWGDRKVLLLGLGATAAALAVLALFVVPRPASVPGLVPLAAGLLLVGLLGGSVNGSSGRAVMAWFHEGERGLAMSIRQTAVPAGGGVGALMLPPLALHIGFGAVYGVLAALCAVTAGFAWRWLVEPPDETAAASLLAMAPVIRGDAYHVASHSATGVENHSATGVANHAALHSAPAHAQKTLAPTRPHAAPSGRNPLTDPGAWRVAFGIGALCVPQLAVLTFATVFLHDVRHAGVVTLSATMAAVQGGAAIARVWSGHWTDRRGNRRAYMRACSLVTAVLFAMLAVVVALLAGQGASTHGAGTAALVGLIVAGGIAASAWHGVAFTELATLAGTQRAGTALAMGNTFAFMTLFVTPLAIPVLLTLGAWPAVWAATSVCALIALPVFPRATVLRMTKPARA